MKDNQEGEDKVTALCDIKVISLCAEYTRMCLCMPEHWHSCILQRDVAIICYVMSGENIPKLSDMLGAH